MLVSFRVALIMDILLIVFWALICEFVLDYTVNMSFVIMGWQVVLSSSLSYLLKFYLFLFLLPKHLLALYFIKHAFLLQPSGSCFILWFYRFRFRFFILFFLVLGLMPVALMICGTDIALASHWDFMKLKVGVLLSSIVNASWQCQLVCSATLRVT